MSRCCLTTAARCCGTATGRPTRPDRARPARWPSCARSDDDEAARHVQRDPAHAHPQPSTTQDSSAAGTACDAVQQPAHAHGRPRHRRRAGDRVAVVPGGVRIHEPYLGPAPMTRVAIVGDIHGNLPTCRRILQHLTISAELWHFYPVATRHHSVSRKLDTCHKT